jgi:hypothetical protein
MIDIYYIRFVWLMNGTPVLLSRFQITLRKKVSKCFMNVIVLNLIVRGHLPVPSVTSYLFFSSMIITIEKYFWTFLSSLYIFIATFQGLESIYVLRLKPDLLGPIDRACLSFRTGGPEVEII